MGLLYLLVTYMVTTNQISSQQLNEKTVASFRSEVWQDYIHKVPVIFRDNHQRECHKLYGPLTSVM